MLALPGRRERQVVSREFQYEKPFGQPVNGLSTLQGGEEDLWKGEQQIQGLVLTSSISRSRAADLLLLLLLLLGVWRGGAGPGRRISEATSG